MTQPLESCDQSHVDVVRQAAVSPATTETALDRVLRNRNGADVELIASVLEMWLRTPEGQAAIVAALDLDGIRQVARDTANRAARRAITGTPVPPHSHRAQNIIITTLVRGLSKIGMAIGAVIGSLLAWWLLSVYAVTTVTFGTPGEMHGASVVWIKSAIAVVVIALFTTLGALFGPRKKQQERMTNANIVLDSTHTHQGRVPAYSAVAATARHKSPEDDQ